MTCTLVGSPLVVPATERKIDDLLGRMTLDEKIGQLNQYSSTFDLTGPVPAGGKKLDLRAANRAVIESAAQ